MTAAYASYFRPHQLDDALTWLKDNQGIVAAGCTDLFPATAKQSLDGPVLDITAVPEISGVTMLADSFRIGAATTWTGLINSDLPASFDGLKAAAREIGSIQIQNSGTIGGNLCHASPAADSIPPLLTLDAEVELTSANSSRRLPLPSFLTGPRQTKRKRDEILTAVYVPKQCSAGVSAFSKLGARRYLVISIAMVAVRLEIVDDQIADVAISIGACGPVAVRLSALEKELTSTPVAAFSTSMIVESSIVPHLSAIDDIRADTGYRETAAVELIRRTVSRCVTLAREEVR
jgi:CO/xanthine dehydrogenase FAD-binding subunit